jgi:hypothetical protein
MSGPLTIPTIASSISGEVEFIAAATNLVNVPSPLIDWLSEKVDGVEEDMVSY